MIALFTQAKKFLDSDKDYVDKIAIVETINLSVAREQLEWMGKDLTDPKSIYFSRTVDSERYFYQKTRDTLMRFERIRRCRRNIRLAHLGCETAKWASLFAIILVLFFTAGSYLAWPSGNIRGLFIFECISFVSSVAGFIIAEIALQTIRTLHIKTTTS